MSNNGFALQQRSKAPSALDSKLGSFFLVAGEGEGVPAGVSSLEACVETQSEQSGQAAKE